MVKSASPDSQDVIDKTVNTIKSRLAAVNEARKQKVAELDKIKSQWYVLLASVDYTLQIVLILEVY